MIYPENFLVRPEIFFHFLEKCDISGNIFGKSVKFF